MADSDLDTDIADIREIAEEDAKYCALYGASLNPFSTVGAETLWEQGWAGVRPANLVDGSINWRRWQRGVQARILFNERKRHDHHHH